jgi:hypothetical protein
VKSAPIDVLQTASEIERREEFKTELINRFLKINQALMQHFLTFSLPNFTKQSLMTNFAAY